MSNFSFLVESSIAKIKGAPSFDSVRAPFIEGEPVYPGGTFRKKNRVQICVRNLDNIKGYFHVMPQKKA